MAKYGSPSFAVLLVDGYNVLAAKLQGFRWKISAMEQKCDGLGDTWEQHCPTGVSKTEIAQDGAYLDDATNSMHSAFSAAGITARIVTWAPFGNTIGKAFVGVQSAFSLVYEVLGKVGSLTNANVTYTASGQLDRGVIVQSWTAKTIDWNTKTDGQSVDYTLDPSQRVIPIASASKAATCVITTSVPHGLTTGQVILIAGNSLSGPAINGERTVTVTGTTTFTIPVNTSGSSGAGTDGTFVLSSTVNGAVGYQQVSDFTGFSGFIGKIRHSADDSTYADLITFTNVTVANTAERLTVAGTVNRYLSFNGDVTGSGSITPFVGLKRG